MKLKAKQSTCINTPKGLYWVQGEERSDDGVVTHGGEVVEVADDFVVNLDVWDILEEESWPDGAPGAEKVRVIAPSLGKHEPGPWKKPKAAKATAST